MRAILCVMIVLIAGEVFAQMTIPSKVPQRCGTMEMDSINRLRHPERGSREEFDRLVTDYAEVLRKSNNGRTQAIVSVPVVFHIVHNGEAVGTGANLSAAQVQAQIAVLNEDFRRAAGSRGFNTNPVGADIEVEFCLSPVDANGVSLTEPGIHRMNGNRASWTRDQIEAQLKPSSIWNPNLFYNVWSLNFSDSESLLGYAQWPDQSGLQGIPANSPASTDGVVISYRVCGSSDRGSFPVMQAPYDKGRTLTHETGHWFGLRHIWGDTQCGDDFVADTPTQRTESRGCPTIFGCDGSTPAMVRNYMDYSDDACFNVFTVGQKNRMLAAISLSPRRRSVVQANLCSPPVADIPVANFVANNSSCVLLGSEIEFTDLSSNFPTSWSWTFEGGDPGASTDRNPKVVFNSPGTFKVTLTATNAIGASAPFTIEDYITVSEQGLCNTMSNFDADEHTRSVIKASALGSYTGYLAGNNSAASKAFSEFYENSCGYKYISGARIRFGKVTLRNEDARVNVVVWSARGAQGGPNPVIERKEVLLREIQDDIVNNRATAITFDRLTPIFSRPFHIGIEVPTTAGDTVAVTSSANGEATNATSWVQNSAGQWQLMTLAFGANIAMDIEPMVGANPSVQIASSKLMIYPGEEVILNGQGASIFVWNSSDGSVTDFAGPQITVSPTRQTTYTIAGSGLDLCNTTATTTIYIRETVVGVETAITRGINLFPNPGVGLPSLEIDNEYSGDVEVSIHNSIGTRIGAPSGYVKDGRVLSVTLPGDAGDLRSGVYLVTVKLGSVKVIRKWVKL